MAKLTDTLATERSGKETMNPVTPGPSLFSGLVTVANTVLDAQEGAQDTRERADAKRRQAEKDALEAEKLEASNAAAQSLFNIGSFDPTTLNPVPTDAKLPPPVDSELPGLSVSDERAVAGAGQVISKAATLDTAVQQGRMTRQTYELMIESEIRRLFALYPNQKALVYAAFDKAAIEHPIFSEMRRLEEDEDIAHDAQAKREQEWIDAAGELEGISSDTHTPEQMMKIGREAIAAKNKGEIARAQAQEARAAATFSEAERKAANEAGSLGTMLEYESTAGIYMTDMVEQIRKLVINGEIPPDQLAKITDTLIPNFRSTGQAMIKKWVIEAQAKGMTPEHAEKLQKNLSENLDNVLEDFDPANPVNVLQRNARLYKILETTSQLKGEQMVPLFNMLKRTFGTGPELEAIVQQFFADPKVGVAITHEMQNFSLLDEQQQTVRLKTAIAVLTDKHTQLRDLTPEQGKQALQDTAQYRSRIMGAAVSGTNARAEELALNATGKISIAGVDVGFGAPTADLLNVSSLLASDETYKLLKQSSRRPENEEMAGLIADSSRAAVQKNLIALSQKGATANPFFKIVYDIGAREFVIQRTDKKPPNRFRPGSDMGLGGGFMPGLEETVKPDKQLLAIQGALNKDLKFLEATSSFEDELPLSKASLVERALYYAKGEVPASLRAKDEDKAPTAATLLSQLDKMWAEADSKISDLKPIEARDVVERETGRISSGVQINEDGSRTARGIKGQEVVIPPISEIDAKYKDNPIYQKLKATASMKGVPVDVALRLGFLEGKFQAKAAAGGSADAYGPMQITKTWDDEIMRRYGKKRRDLTPEENIDMGLWILNQNFKATGSWKDAVAMYHSGQDYAGSGGHDGNLRTRDYADLISG